MKILKIILICLSVLAILIFAGIVIFLSVFKIDKYLPQISQQISQAIGRQVTINHADLNFNLASGLALDLKTISVSDQPKGGKDFVVVDKTHVGMDLTTLLFKREIKATDIKLSAIQVNASPYYILIQDIVVKVSTFSLDKPFDFTLDITAYSKGPQNIELTGTVSLDLKNNAAQINNLKMTSDLSQWDWARVRTIAPVLKDCPVWISRDIKGRLVVNVSPIQASAKEVSDLSVTTQLQTGSGAVDAKINLQSIMNAPKYDFVLTSKGVKLEEILDQSALPMSIKGALNGQLTGAGAGFDPKPMMDNLTASGELALSDAKIEKLNILNTILANLNFIPGLGGMVETAIPEDIKSKLNTESTSLDKVNAKIKLANQTVSLEPAVIESKELFAANVHGTVTFEQIINLDVDAYLAKDLSASMVKKARPLQGLLDDQGRIYIPGHSSGKIPGKYLPKTDYILKKVATAEGTEQLSKQLDKVLEKNPQVKNIIDSVFGGGSTQQEGSSSQNGDNTQDNQDSSSKKTINNLLKNILK